MSQPDRDDRPQRGSPPKAQRVDDLLRAWAADALPDAAHLAAIRARGIDAADRLADEGAESPGCAAKRAEASEPAASFARPGHAARWRGRMAWFLSGVAAAAVVAMVLVQGRREEPAAARHVRPSQPNAPAGAEIGQTELANFARLLAEMKRVFPDQLTWVAETNGQVLLGLEPPTQAGPTDSPAVTVRLVVMGRRPGETEWRRCWGIDCVAYDEQVVDLAPGDASQPRLALWAHLLPDGMIAVDTSLAMETLRGEASTTSVQRPRQPQQIFDFQSDGSEYRVFQTVAVLPEEVG